MSEKFEKLDKKKLPWYFKLILKVPVPSLSPSSKFSGGIFWAIIVPILVFLNVFLDFIILINFPFPINIFLVCLVPVVIFLIFAKVMLERFINWWNASVIGGYAQREIKVILDEYLACIRKKPDEQSEA